MRFLGHLSKSWLVEAKLKKKKKKKEKKTHSAWNKWECCKMTEILLNNLYFFQHLLINVYLNGRILSKSIIKNHQYSNFLQVAESSQKKFKGTDTASSLIKTPKKTVDAATCETLETPNNLRRDDSRRLKEKGIIDFVVILVQYSAEIFSSYMKKKIHFLFE